MKSFIGVLCFFVLATLVVSIHSLTQKEKEILQIIIKECQQAANATDKELKDIREKNKISNSPEMKKHLGCVAGRVGYVKDDGEFNKEWLLEMLKLSNNKDKAEEIIQTCAIKKKSKEETGYNLLKCVIDEKGTKFKI